MNGGRARLRITMQTDRLADDFDPEMLIKIKHPHIVRVYETKRIGQEIILWEEYIQGNTLTDWIRKNTASKRGKKDIPYRKIKSILIQLCHAVQYLHEMRPNQIIHGDIKPDNIMVMRSGQIKLIDFSASRMIVQDRPPTIRYGTPYFTAPEVYRGEPAGRLQDIYGIGVTLLYMLCGPVTIQAVDKEKAILCDETCEVLPLLHIAYQCIREDPEQRYQTVGEMLSKVNRKGKRP